MVEYTLFSEDLLEKEEYENGIKEYLERYYPGIDYVIQEEEEGVIPMTDHRFSMRDGNIVHIGTAGGQTKGSTGFTFSFIQKQSSAIVDALIRTGKPFARRPGGFNRFRFYDSVLLEILQAGKLPAHTIFSRLFTRNPTPRVFRFLDNETSLKEEFSLLKTLPAIPFLKAAIRQI